jgi:acetolactate synthase-1/2/3 large subunit
LARIESGDGAAVFSIYDGCVADGIEIVDTRHEQAAAESWSALSRAFG